MSSWHQFAKKLANEQLLSAGQWVVDNRWPMSSWHQLDNKQFLSDGQWAADISWTMSSSNQLAREQLTSVGQWAANISWQMSSWYQIANEQRMLVGQWEADIHRPMQLHGYGVFIWCFSVIFHLYYRATAVLWFFSAIVLHCCSVMVH